MRLIFLGMPGAGKGTQAARLSAKANIPQISTGEILRKAVKDGTEMGKKAKVCMDKGELLPDDIIVGIVKDRLLLPDCKDGYILDGFPRTIAQADALNEVLDEDAAIDKVIFLDVDDEEVVARLTGRRSCSKCGEGYHITFAPPKNEGICDKCSGQLLQRSDDNEESIRTRLSVYREKTSPLIKYYEHRKLLKTLKGVGSIEKIFSDLYALCIS